ncbi:MAG: alpha/beta hydrolase, partial [Nocardioides sp.]|nr:alpha/beta hydrolase [Nocardioides sp.]
GWSLGGTFALLAAAADPSLPIASIAVLGSPFDVSQVPLVAPLRPLLNLTDGRGAITRLYRAAGGAPQPLVRWAFQLSSFQKLVTKPLALAWHLDDADYLAQIEAVDRFTANMSAYPGRTFGQLYHRLLKANGLVDGTFEVGGRTLDVAEITAPVLVFGGANDTIAPVAAVKAAVPLLTGAREVRFEIVPGGHLGMLTGRAARTGTWPQLDAWIDEWTESGAEPDHPADDPEQAATPREPATPRTTTKKTAKKEPATAMPVVEKGPAPGDDPPEIGTNPERRYGSAGSRALRR